MVQWWHVLEFLISFPARTGAREKQKLLQYGLSNIKQDNQNEHKQKLSDNWMTWRNHTIYTKWVYFIALA